MRKLIALFMLLIVLSTSSMAGYVPAQPEPSGTQSEFWCFSTQPWAFEMCRWFQTITEYVCLGTEG